MRNTSLVFRKKSPTIATHFSFKRLPCEHFSSELLEKVKGKVQNKHVKKGGVFHFVVVGTFP